MNIHPCLFPVYSPILNLSLKYCFCFSLNRTLVVVFDLRAQPIDNVVSLDDVVPAVLWWIWTLVNCSSNLAAYSCTTLSSKVSCSSALSCFPLSRWCCSAKKAQVCFRTTFFWTGKKYYCVVGTFLGIKIGGSTDTVTCWIWSILFGCWSLATKLVCEYFVFICNKWWSLRIFGDIEAG